MGGGFVEQLRASRLLTAEQIERLTQGAEQAPATLADRLVAEGMLTRFQADMALAGQGRQLILGQYRLLAELGKGGMGVVYKAHHTVMGRTVAIKVLAPVLQSDARAVEWFEREVRALTQMHHPNIALAYDANEMDGLHFLVMEYVEGENLQSLVKSRHPLPVAHVCEIVVQSALALQYAHERGMVHRDIKPGNLLIPAGALEDYSAWLLDAAGESGEELRPRPTMVKVVDFGLARLRNLEASGTIRLQSDDHFIGTPDYASPEQCRDVHAVDIRSDLYSLGCAFYFALAGAAPFEKAGVLEKMALHLVVQPTPIEELRPDVPAGVSAVLRQLLAKDPAQRFQTPLALAQALRPWCTSAGKSLAASGPQLFGRPARPKTPSSSELSQSLACLHATSPKTSVLALEPSIALPAAGEGVAPLPRAEELAPVRRNESLTDADVLAPALSLANLPAVLEVPATPPPTDTVLPTEMILLSSVEQALRERESQPPVRPAAAPQPSGPEPSLESVAANWRLWSDVITSFAGGQGRGRWDHSRYRQLYDGLMTACLRGANGPAGKRGLYRQLRALVEPWVSLESLERTEPDILKALQARCEQAEEVLGIARPWRHAGRWLRQWTAPLLVLLLLALGGVVCRLLWLATDGGARRLRWPALLAALPGGASSEWMLFALPASILAVVVLLVRGR
jgi:serine/threonine protein kinase